MAFTAFDIDGCHGACRAVVLAGATSKTLALVDGGTAVDHHDGRRRTVAGAGTAANAVVRQHHGMANTDGGLLLFVNRLDGTCRAYLTATRAGRAAVALVESHVGLHERGEFGGGAQHLLGALANAELAGGAVGIEVFDAL